MMEYTVHIELRSSGNVTIQARSEGELKEKIEQMDFEGYGTIEPEIDDYDILSRRRVE